MDTPRTIIVTRTTPDAARHDPDALILAPVAQQMLGRSRSSRERDTRAGLLPAPIRVSYRRTAYLRRELDAIIAARAAGATDDELRALTRRLLDDRARRAEALGVGPAHQTAEARRAL
ncbi:MAG: helix-turn-helix transcriptional regulator [Pseudomonadota bacterium]|jgi:prophage regulatory protein